MKLQIQIGIINQTIHRKYIHTNILSLTPGIHIQQSSDNLGQQYRRPLQLEHQPDIMIIGRAIYNSSIPRKVIEEIKKNNIL